MCKERNAVCMPLDGKVQCIDACIHHIVAALNAGGVRTLWSCCGHDGEPLDHGVIALDDGRKLVVLTDEHYDSRFGRLRAAEGNGFLPLPDPQTFGACYDCGRRYGDEYGFPDLVVDNEDWQQISPRHDEGGLLCPSCMCRRAHALNLRVEARFMSGPFAVGGNRPNAALTEPQENE